MVSDEINQLFSKLCWALGIQKHRDSPCPWGEQQSRLRHQHKLIRKLWDLCYSWGIYRTLREKKAWASDWGGRDIWTGYWKMSISFAKKRDRPWGHSKDQSARKNLKERGQEGGSGGVLSLWKQGAFLGSMSASSGFGEWQSRSGWTQEDDGQGKRENSLGYTWHIGLHLRLLTHKIRKTVAALQSCGKNIHRVRVVAHLTWLFGGVHQMTIFLKVGTQ